jgi:hypothetical protein
LIFGSKIRLFAFDKLSHCVYPTITSTDRRFYVIRGAKLRDPKNRNIVVSQRLKSRNLGP